ncbi:hypothetical protein Lal_00012767 [Lupinus albus]|nr:hypothetical protein Lal_00012767 [Lupinus albus]
MRKKDKRTIFTKHDSLLSDSLHTKENDQNYTFYHITWELKLKEALKRVENDKTNKGDIHNCANYKAIKLMSHTMKIWKRIIELRLRQEMNITENQFGFMSERSTIKTIYLLR